MTKKKIILIFVLLSVLVVLINMPIKANIGWAPGYSVEGPMGMPACLCDFWPPYCWCGRIN